ncbi:MAG: hypothetical protein ACXQS7_05280, partial [Candidatus Syntropharchaeia archaeon]
MRRKICTFILIMFVFGIFFPQVTAEYREKYVGAKEKYMHVKEKFSNSRSLEIKKSYMLSAFDYIISYLEMLKGNMEFWGAPSPEALENLDRYIRWMERKKTGVKNAGNIRELNSIARSTTREWRKVRGEIEYYTMYTSGKRLGVVLDRMENFSRMMQGKIKELESAGKDVKTLKNKIEHYNELVEKAREEQRRGMDNLASR